MADLQKAAKQVDVISASMPTNNVKVSNAKPTNNANVSNAKVAATIAKDASKQKNALLASVVEQQLKPTNIAHNLVYAPPLTSASHDSSGNVKHQDDFSSAENATQGSDDAQSDDAQGSDDASSSDDAAASSSDDDAQSDDAQGSDAASSSDDDDASSSDAASSSDDADSPPPLNGTIETIGPSGKIVATYKAGLLHGPTDIFNIDGVLEKHVVFENGKMHGECVSYENGVKRAESEFKEGELDGVSRMFGDEGELLSETTFRAGKKQGEMKQYHDNGKPQSIASFAEDKMHGDFATFSRDGKPEIHATYHENAFHGTMRNFFTTGVCEKNGNEDGDDASEIDAEKREEGGNCGGKIQREAEYANGVLNGEEKIFHASGALFMTSTYENGVLRAQKIQNKKGGKRA